MSNLVFLEYSKSFNSTFRLQKYVKLNQILSIFYLSVSSHQYLLKTLQFKLVVIFLICNFNLKLYKIVWITSELAYLVCYSLAFIHLPQSQNSETCNFLKPSCSKHSGSFDLKLSKKHVVFLPCQSLKLVKLVSIASIYITFVYAISI